MYCGYRRDDVWIPRRHSSETNERGATWGCTSHPVESRGGSSCGSSHGRRQFASKVSKKLKWRRDKCQWHWQRQSQCPSEGTFMSPTNIPTTNFNFLATIFPFGFARYLSMIICSGLAWEPGIRFPSFPFNQTQYRRDSYFLSFPPLPFPPPDISLTIHPISFLLHRPHYMPSFQSFIILHASNFNSSNKGK